MNRRPGPYRLPLGGAVNRRQQVSFQFNGRSYEGYAGDTLASALLANGVRTVARSFKFHRPRGIFSAGMEEPGALVQLGEGAETLPAVRATLAELVPRITARSISGWPSLNFDLGRVLDFTAPLWSAGFYNKTFIWPSWHTYEPFIRRMAGFGWAPPLPDPDRYETNNIHCDVLVVGGGVAGIEAASKHARAGARVVLVEQDRELGRSDGTVPPGLHIKTRTTATGFYDHNVVTLLERVAPGKMDEPRERFWTVRAGKVVLATGRIEQPLIFAHNDRPGIVLASAALQYLRRYGVAVGSRVVIATNNDSAYEAAAELHQAGVRILGIADSRHDAPQAFQSNMQLLKIPHFIGAMPVDTAGFSGLRRVTLGWLSRDGTGVTRRQTFECDSLVVSGGFNPALSLFAQSGGKLAFHPASGSLQPRAPVASLEIVGSAAVPVPIGQRVSPVGDRKRQWVDLLHDVTVADLKLALQENYTSVEHVKRYTTVGMAADQGKTSAAPTLEILGQLQGIAAETLGHTTLRPPVTPVTLGAIAGREIREHFSPHKRLPMHDWHVANGALIQEFSEWRRPVAYLKPGETREQAVQREARQVRTSAALLDSSSFGKIEIHGPDAGPFLDRFYINDLTTLKPYRARYCLMLKETGILFDDGTVVMLAPDRYVITTTSSNAGRVAQWLEEWRQCEWPNMRVAIVPVTEAWATASLTGPKAREILSTLTGDIDLSPTAFPHLTMREGRLMGIPTRVYRVSFTGEITYEINVPTDHGPALWEALLTAGGSSLQPLGLDALMLLRLEKGFLHLGSDTDGTTVPDDVGWGAVAARKPGDFVGKRSLRLPEYSRPDRLQLVGLQGESGIPFVIGSHLRVGESKQSTDGWVTSAGCSVEENRPIALAMVRGGRSRVGQSVSLYDSGRQVGLAKVVNPPFYDSAGERMNA
jgi:sarcosine oxidase, subunit alpha